MPEPVRKRVGKLGGIVQLEKELVLQPLAAIPHGFNLQKLKFRSTRSGPRSGQHQIQ